MKCTIYVPDDLWDAVSKRGEKPSHTIKRALERLKEAEREAPEPFDAVGSDIDMETVERRVDELLKGARETFNLGYRAGVLWAGRLDWPGFEMLLDDATPEALAADLARHFEKVQYDDPSPIDRAQSDPLTALIDDRTFEEMASMTGVYHQPGPPEETVSALACRTGSLAAAQAMFDFYHAVQRKLRVQAAPDGSMRGRGPVLTASGGQNGEDTAALNAGDVEE